MVPAFSFINYQLPVVLALSVLLIPSRLRANPAVTEESIHAALVAHALPLHGAGEAQLIAEARSHDFFLLGELHGEHYRTSLPICGLSFGRLDIVMLARK